MRLRGGHLRVVYNHHHYNNHHDDDITTQIPWSTTTTEYIHYCDRRHSRILCYFITPSMTLDPVVDPSLEADSDSGWEYEYHDSETEVDPSLLKE